MASIPDSDGGRWDGDTTWDRAVGPMQFIPTTWRSLGRDGNGDRVADPNNLFDAAVSAAGYLCLGGGGDLSDPARLRQAVYGYNHSWAYVDAVLGWARLYQGGVATGPGRSRRAARAVHHRRPAHRAAGQRPAWGRPDHHPPAAHDRAHRPRPAAGRPPRRPADEHAPADPPGRTTGSPTTTTEPCQPTTTSATSRRVGHHHDLDHHHDHRAGGSTTAHDPAALRLTAVAGPGGQLRLEQRLGPGQELVQHVGRLRPGAGGRAG